MTQHCSHVAWCVQSADARRVSGRVRRHVCVRGRWVAADVHEVGMSAGFLGSVRFRVRTVMGVAMEACGLSWVLRVRHAVCLAGDTAEAVVGRCRVSRPE